MKDFLVLFFLSTIILSALQAGVGTLWDPTLVREVMSDTGIYVTPLSYSFSVTVSKLL